LGRDTHIKGYLLYSMFTITSNFPIYEIHGCAINKSACIIYANSSALFSIKWRLVWKPFPHSYRIYANNINSRLQIWALSNVTREFEARLKTKSVRFSRSGWSSACWRNAKGWFLLSAWPNHRASALLYLNFLKQKITILRKFVIIRGHESTKWDETNEWCIEFR